MLVFLGAMPCGDSGQEDECSETESRLDLACGKIPTPGEYSPEPVGDMAPEYDFGKAVGRMSPPRDVDDFDEGDMLVLETDVPPKVPMLVNMDK